MTVAQLDLYAVLQVLPDAEDEIIAAAYRQLMRKYHPDVAHADPARAAQLHERAKVINQAYAILRDPHQRLAYDRMRLRGFRQAASPAYDYGRSSSSGGASRASGAAPAADTAAPPVSSADAAKVPAGDSERGAWWLVDAPANMLASAYYLLPGPYEWEPASRRELLFTMLIAPVGVLGWLTVTGHLAPLLG